MYYKSERARTAQNTAQAMAKRKFDVRLNSCTDAVFCNGSRTRVLAAYRPCIRDAGVRPSAL